MSEETQELSGSDSSVRYVLAAKNRNLKLEQNQCKEPGELSVRENAHCIRNLLLQ